MFTTEMTVIIPLIIVLVLAALIMFFMVTELSFFEMSNSRDFLLRTVPEGNINAYVVQMDAQMDTSDWGLWQTIHYNNQATRSNRYSDIWGKAQMDMSVEYRKIWINKQVAAFVKSGYERFSE